MTFKMSLTPSGCIFLNKSKYLSTEMYVVFGSNVMAKSSSVFQKKKINKLN